MNRKNNKDAIIFRHDVILKFSWRCFVSRVKLSYWSKFHVNVVTGSGVMTISFVRDWPEIRKLEITLSEFSPKSADWSDIGIPNLAKMYLTKCCWILQNARVTAFTVSELLKENQQGVKLPPAPPPALPRLGPANIRLDEDVLKTFSRRLRDVLPRRLQNVFKKSCKKLFKTSSRRLQDVLQKSLQDIFKMSSRRFQDVFKTSSWHLQDAFETFWRRLEDVLKMSWRRKKPERFQDVSSSYTVLVNKFSRCLQDVFTTFLRRTAKTVIYRRICLGHTFEKFMVSVQNLQERQQFLKF